MTYLYIFNLLWELEGSIETETRSSKGKMLFTRFDPRYSNMTQDELYSMLKINMYIIGKKIEKHLGKFVFVHRSTINKAHNRF